MRNGRRAATELLLFSVQWSMAPSPLVRAPFNFADSVQRYPCLNPEEVRLVAFDWENVRRFEANCHRRDADAAHVALLRLTREQYPAPPSHLRLS